MAHFKLIIVLALTLAAFPAHSADIPTFEQFELHLVFLAFPELSHDPSAVETILVQIAETEIRESQAATDNPGTQKRALVRAGDAYHWLGHYLESQEKREKAFSYHYLAWLQYREAGLPTSSGLSGLNPLHHAEFHLVMLARGFSLSHYLYLRRFQSRIPLEEWDPTLFAEALKAADCARHFVDGPPLQTLHHTTACAHWLVERIEASTRTDPRLRVDRLFR